LVLVGFIVRARAEGTLRPDATFADVGLTLVRLAHPLPRSFPRALDGALAHRHLQLVIDGLRAGAHAEPLPGPALSLDGLRSVAVEPAGRADRASRAPSPRASVAAGCGARATSDWPEPTSAAC
jgi:hypothetical protein